MNIFYLDEDTRKCAEYHCDKHVVKMLVEYTQLLCSAIHLSGGTAPYRLTHKNHPCAIWVRQSTHHWIYLQQLIEEVNMEYSIRYQKYIHKSASIAKQLICPNIPNAGWIDPPQCMPDQYKCDSTVQAYRNYYLGDKRSFATWKIQQPPWWV